MKEQRKSENLSIKSFFWTSEQPFAIHFLLVSCNVFPWRFQKSVRKHKDPTTGNSFIHQNIKIARDYRALKLGCSDGCGLHHSTHRKGHQSKLLVVHSRGSRWNFSSEACFSGDPRASCVGPQHDRGRSDTVMISMNFDSYATLAIFCIIPVLSCFFPFQSDWLIAACFTRV